MLPIKSKYTKYTSGRRIKKKSDKPAHLTWEFKPKLGNEAHVLHNILGIYDIPYYKVMVNDIRKLITQLIQNHGFNDGSKRYKIIKDYTIQLIEGRNPVNPEWLATSERHNIPSKLGRKFIQLIVDYNHSTDPALRANYYQVINTILNINRMIEGEVDADYESVTNKAEPIDQLLLENFRNYVAKSFIGLKPIDNNVNLFKTRFNIKKNGPNSRPKIESAEEEAYTLMNSKMARPFRIICEELNCLYLLDYLTLLSDNIGKDLKESNLQSEVLGTTHLRKLVSIPDAGFKTRLVAIVDFWTQLVLEPIRSHVQRVIEIKYGNTDFRKSHDLGVAKMYDFTERCLANEVLLQSDGNSVTLDVQHLKCYDISSWTDRFHRDLQKIMMKELFGGRISEAWGQLVVHCDWYSPNLGHTIKYGQGQGMGTNGSFDIATLTDHLFINYVIDCETNFKGIFPGNECYGKVGDDLWIYDPEDKIQEFYAKINLPINFSKSKTSVDGNSITEFCARNFYNNLDVSRISPKVISKSRNFRYMPMLLGICSSRGIQLDASSFDTLNHRVKNTDETYLDKMQGWLVAMLLVGQYEESPYWSHLNIDYLADNNWISGDLIPKIFSDPKLVSRLMISHSIVGIVENLETVQDKLFDTVDAMDDFGDNIIRLTEEGTNLFDPKDPMHEELATVTDRQYLSLKQIVVFGRYVDQRNYIQESLIEANEELELSDEINSIVEYGKKLAQIAHASCYDEGNINYSTERIFSAQYKIVKTLGRLDEDFKILYLDSTSQIRRVYGLNMRVFDLEEWNDYCPEIREIDP